MKKILTVFFAFSMLFLFVPFHANATTTYATWNPSDMATDLTLTSGNLILTKNASNAWHGVRSTIAPTSGKWYWEIHEGVVTSGNTPYAAILTGDANLTGAWDTASSPTNVYSYGDAGGDGNCAGIGWTSTIPVQGDVIGVAYDVDGGTVAFYLNNVLEHTCTNVPSGLYAGTQIYNSGDTDTVNFGATSLTYSPPSGYNAGLYSGARTVNRIAKFTTSTDFGNSLFSDDGSNMTLTSGNLFMQIGSLIDTITGGALNFGTTYATTMTFGRSGQYAIFNSNVGIGTTSPLSLFSIGTAGNAFRVNSSGAVEEGTWNGSPIAVTNGGTGATTLTGLLQGNGTSNITAVTGTSGQIPYYNGTNTLNATSTISISTGGLVSIGTTTATKMLNLGNDNGITNGTTTIKMGKIQFDGYNSSGVRTCMFIQGTTIKAVAGACK